MSKTLLYRLFRLGRIPPKTLAALRTEGLALWDEGLPGRAYMRVLRAPGKRFKHRLVWFSGSLALTQKRLMAHAFNKRVIHIPLDDARLLGVDLRLVDERRMEFAFDPGLFHPDWSGDLTLRFTTPKAREFHTAIEVAKDTLRKRPD
jgi:hypothetical protein